MKKIVSLFVCALACVSIYAQTQKVSGTVLDAKTGETLIGVSVLESGTTNGVVTDLDGNFTLNVQKNAELQYRMWVIKLSLSMPKQAIWVSSRWSLRQLPSKT